MAPVRRYYSDDDERGLTPSQLKKLGKARQRAYLTFWFKSYFEDPANQTPYESAEGGYQYIWGGPYVAVEQLDSEFGHLVSAEVIESVATELENEEGIYDWAPSSNHADMAAREDEDRDDENTEIDVDFEGIIKQLRNGLRPAFGDSFEAQSREKFLSNALKLRDMIDELIPSHGGIGHNNPPPDIEPLLEIKTEVDAVVTELRRPKPDALVVAEASSKLKMVLSWSGQRAKAAVDGIIKGIAV